MLPNGVSAMSVESDLAGMYRVLQWLSYVPAQTGERFPITPPEKCVDPITRSVDFFPDGKCDSRLLISGVYEEKEEFDMSESFDSPSESSRTTHGLEPPSPLIKDHTSQSINATWVSGLFDQDSFVEYLCDWAKTVVAGRARLGSIPVGVIAVETQQQDRVIPPDPADDTSCETVGKQAGQVWYPDSAFKTAQAIRDFGGEELPLFILANWRGFSGGQRDMFDEILKQGSYIVDALSEYKYPIFVYIPPHCELRGGAWVVLDTKINPQQIEMYASLKAHANVLEPTGTIGLKYRAKSLKETMHRLDDELRRLDAELEDDEKMDEVKLVEIEREIANREHALMPLYKKIAMMFVELHDRPGRMKSVGAIRDIVPWKFARTYFYWRLRAKLARIDAVKKIAADLNGLIDDDEAEHKFNDFVDEFWQSQDRSMRDVGMDGDEEVGQATELGLDGLVLGGMDSYEQTCQKEIEAKCVDEQEFVEWFAHQNTAALFMNHIDSIRASCFETKLHSLVNSFNGDRDALNDMLRSMISDH